MNLEAVSSAGVFLALSQLLWLSQGGWVLVGCLTSTASLA